MKQCSQPGRVVSALSSETSIQDVLRPVRAVAGAERRAEVMRRRMDPEESLVN